tara:strand:+ start:1208 stop:1633 length:426 start_codon:yes stop_codon:yes gene_type:complete
VEGLFNGLTIKDVHEDIHRNIVSLRVSEDLSDTRMLGRLPLILKLRQNCTPTPTTSRSNLLSAADWQDIEGVEIERNVFLVRCDSALLDFRAKFGPIRHSSMQQFNMMATQASYQDLPVVRVIFAPFLINGFYPIQDNIVI